MIVIDITIPDYDEVFKLVNAIATDTAFSTEENHIFGVYVIYFPSYFFISEYNCG